MEGQEPPPCPSPSPYKNPSDTFRDISNLKTPKRSSKLSNFHYPSPQFFTASKQTPKLHSSSFRRRPSLVSSNSSRSKNGSRKLKAFELEQSQSSRKAQIQKEHSLKSLAKSLTVWLNFLFENPRSCGCNLSISGDRIGTLPNGKRDNEPSSAVRVDSEWRDPKRQRDSSWRAAASAMAFSSSRYSNLRSSLELVCSVDDLAQRMRLYLSMGNCKEVFDAITQVSRNIDEGRLKMKAHCPLVTDVGLKEKATRILMSYNPTWLRIGLYVVFGGDSLLSERDVNSDEEIRFLKMIIEKQFFAHAGLAKECAYNKMVEGLYRPGYYEALGNVVLKRFLLLVLILDRAKCQSSLSLKYGIDGVDGGSPLLFALQSSIKSSHQVIHDFLSSDVMLGEGNILAHLVILGYKVSYQQRPLVEFDFRVTDLFVDLQDGVRMCRAIQLLQDDTSILMKMVAPADTLKKSLENCGLALQYLRQAGVVLHDEDGMMIVADDIAGGDKELTLSLLWNMFVHLQLPLLVKKTNLAVEICKVRGNVDNLISSGSSSLEMLLNWIQAICENYDCKIDSLSSLIDGKAIWCLLDFYFRKQLCCGLSSKDPNKSSHEESIMLATDYSDAVHNFLLSQKLLTLLGNFPEVLQISDILEYNGACNDRSVVILLVFLSSQLIVKKNMDQLNFHKLLGCDCRSSERKYSCMGCSVRPEAEKIQEESYNHSTEDSVRKFKAIQAWWQDMAERNHSVAKSTAPTLPIVSTNKDEINIRKVNAAKRIQSHFRRAIERGKFLKMLSAATFLQTVVRAWISVRQKSACMKFSIIQVQEFSCERWRQPETWRRYAMFITDRHGFVNLRKSVLLLQRVARNWIIRRRQGGSTITHDVCSPDIVNAAVVVQKYIRGWLARSRYIHGVARIDKYFNLRQENDARGLQIRGAVKIQLAWKNYYVRQSLCYQHLAATKIQSHFRSWQLRRRFQIQKQAIIKIQSVLRMSRCWKAYQKFKVATASATVIQSYVRGCVARKGADQSRHLIVAIQRHYRGWLIRNYFSRQREAAIKIQSAIRRLKCSQAFHRHRQAAVEIQRIVRGQISRNRFLGASSLRPVIAHGCILTRKGAFHMSAELNMVLCSVLKLQRWWRGVMSLKLRTKSASIIQSHIRGWFARQNATKERQCIVVIQSYWRGYLARKKETGGQLLDLRLRVQKSATNVDDSMRIINRLVAALSELQTMKSLSGILHICVTLDKATQHSQKCCERLVEAGAIKTLLKIFRSLTRSIPDQEVLKHVLSTLRNLARYPHLVEALIDTHECVETVLVEFRRNKGEGYFIAAELLKKICASHKGVEAIRKSPGHLKRLHSLIGELGLKADKEKRNARVTVSRENTERRLREAVEILTMALARKESYCQNLD